MGRQLVRCHKSQNASDDLCQVEMHGAKGRGYQAMYDRFRPYVECLSRFRAFSCRDRAASSANCAQASLTYSI